MEDNNNTPEQLDKDEPIISNGTPRGFLRFLLLLACAIAFIPALDIPWNKTEWIDDWHYIEHSSGFFLRALKVILIAISVITWLVLLYIKYKQVTNKNGNSEE